MVVISTSFYSLIPVRLSVNSLCSVLGVKAAALMSQCPEVKPSAEEGPITEQQLGLRQAEERLYRDYIHRLLKVGKPARVRVCACVLLEKYGSQKFNKS